MPMFLLSEVDERPGRSSGVEARFQMGQASVEMAELPKSVLQLGALRRDEGLQLV